MESAAKQNHPTLLSFHAGVLRELLQNNISGLESATQLPESIESFLKTQGEPLLCELAIFGKKAWDEPVRCNWLAFLEKNHNEALLARLRDLDALGVLPLWFAIHFSDTPPSMEVLLTQEAGEKELLSFARDFRHLKERVERIDNRAELEAAWETLVQMQTKAFLAFCAQFPKHTLLQSLQISRLSYDLIQLWDAQIKLVKTCNLLSPEETCVVFGQRINAFAQFGLLAMQHRAIAVGMSHCYELETVLKECSTLNHLRSSDRKFSVQHWIVPRSQVYIPISNDDERFTVIHQNLLRASAFDYTEDHLRLLPLELKNAVKTFQERATTKARRYAGDSSTFISILEESASVTINIPLSVHSFVLTLKQNKGSDKVECNAYWKGNDNSQGGHIEFIQLASSIFGILIKRYSITSPDLHVVFEAANAKQVDSLNRIINSVNSQSLNRTSTFNALVFLLHPRPIQAKTYLAALEETSDARDRVRDILWNQFIETGTVPTAFIDVSMAITFDREYLEERGHYSMVVTRVIEEVEGKRPKSIYSREFFTMAMETLPLEAQKELVWQAVMRELGCFLSIPEAFEKETLVRLYQEAPIIILKYFMKNYQMSKFTTLMESIGDPSSKEQAKLHHCYQLLKKQNSLDSWFVKPLLDSWDALEPSTSTKN